MLLKRIKSFAFLSITTAAYILKRGSGFASPFFAIKNVDVLSNDAKNKKNNAGGDIISYRCNIWIKYK